MHRKTLLDEVLLDLARFFESGAAFWYTPDAIQNEEVQACLAKLVDERSVVCEGAATFQFSVIGYARYLPRLIALRQASWTPSFSAAS